MAIPSNGRPRRHRHRRAAGALATALCATLLAGCGGSSKASGEGGGPTTVPTAAGVAVPPLPADQPQKAACSLATQAEVQEALGGARVTAGKQELQQARSLCAYTLAAATDQSVVLISTSSSGVPDAFKAARSTAPSPQTVSAGDEAFVTGAQAMVRKGNTMVVVLVVVRQPPAQLSAAATKLVQAIGARL